MAKRERRKYSDEQKANALATLDANAGDLSKTARQVRVPRKTLEGWASGRHGAPPAELRQEKKADLASMFESFAERVLTLTTDDEIRAANVPQRFTAAGIAVDKAQLLRGKPAVQPGNNVTVCVYLPSKDHETDQAPAGSGTLPQKQG